MHNRAMSRLAVCLTCWVAPLVAAQPTDTMAARIERYARDAEDVRSYYNIPWSESRAARSETLHRATLAELDAIDFDRLSQDERVDYLLLRNKLRGSLAYAALDRTRWDEMSALLPFRETIVALEEARWRVEPVSGREAAERVAALLPQLKELRRRLDAGRNTPPASAPAAASGATDGPLTVTPVVAARAAAAVSGLRDTLRHWHNYYAEFTPDFAWWMRQPFADADRALGEYADFLRTELAGLKGNPEDPLLGDPIGRDTLLADLQNEVIAYSPEELVAIGEREFAWCEQEMRSAAREMGFGDDWRAALAKVKSATAEPGAHTDLCAALVRESIAFLREKDLVTIPDLAAELWRLEMIPPDRQRIWPFQFYGGLHIGVAYASEHMSHADKMQAMRGNNRHFTRIVVPHELIPGHHLQGFMAQRLRPYRQNFTTPFFLEGWCLYWEMKLWDLGWARGPEDRIGMLFWRMHRCARIVVSLKFHLGQMSPDEMIKFLEERVGHEPANARSEVRRYVGPDYSPLYQAGYMLGGMQLRAMHSEVVGGGRMSEREFNDRLLTLGPIPVELIRASILQTPLRRDHHAQWRFADPAE